MDFDPFKTGMRDGKLSGWYNHREAELYPGIAVAKEDVVLDVGCGEGGITNFCAQFVAQILFTDIDAEKVAATEHKLKNSNASSVKGVVCDCNPILFNDEVADIVVCMEVMEHVDDPADFLRELYRVGKPGARYLISVPDPVSEQLQQGLAAQEYFQKPNHIHIFQRKEFQQLVANSGLEISNIEYQGFYWTLWWLFFWNAGQDLSPPWDPLLTSWAETWSRMLDTPNGPKLKEKLDKQMPKTQVIVARKPG
jgi:ubiquinone/menaquinone biosynthesis C-methylase UbiE